MGRCHQAQQHHGTLSLREIPIRIRSRINAKALLAGVNAEIKQKLSLAAFRSRPEIEQAFSLEELLAHKITGSASSDFSLKDRFSQSVMAGRSGDIILAYKSGISIAAALPTRFIMGHAGPYHHDTAVPIIFWWPSAKAQTRVLPADTTSIAPTLANVIGVKEPGDLDGPCMDIGYPGAAACAK